MSVLNDFHPLILTSLQTSLAVGVLFGLVLLVRRPFARQFGAKAAYALWLAPVARLFMPPLPSNWSLFGLLAPGEPAATAPTVMELQHRAEAVSLQTASSVHSAQIAEVPPAPPAMPVSPAQPDLADPGLLDAVTGVLPHIILPVWIAGMLLMLGVAWRRQTVFHRLIAGDSDAASQEVTSLADQIAGELGVRRAFDVRTSLLSGSPLVTGLARPTILLPAWFEDDYTPRERRDALTHELMHVKRNDLLALQAAQLVLALQWFNPLAHLAMRAFRVDQEAACDADVLRAGTSSAFSYGQTLVKAARLAGPADGAFRGANLTLTHPIKERLILMQNSAPTLRRRLLGSTLAITLGSAAIVVTASCAASAAPLQTSEEELAGGARHTESSSHSYSYSHTTSYSDDETERQFVVLSDPFEKLEPRLEKLDSLDLSDLEEEIEKLSLEMSGMGEFEEMKELEGLHVLGQLSALEDLGDMNGVIDLSGLTLDLDLTASDLEKFGIETVETDSGVKLIIPGHEINLSKVGEGSFSLQMDEIEALVDHAEDRADAMQDALEERIEAQVESRAARMEALAEQMELRIEAAFENNLEEDLELAGDIIEEMADQCEEREPDLTTPTLISFTSGKGETYRALCVSGPHSRLQDADVVSFVEDNPRLTEREKTRFAENRANTYHYSWSRD